MNNGEPLSDEWLTAWEHAMLIEEAKEQEQFDSLYSLIPELIVSHKTYESHLPLKFVTNVRHGKVGEGGQNENFGTLYQ